MLYLLVVDEGGLKVMNTNVSFNNIRNIIFIVSQKEEVSSVQLSLKEHSVFSKSFSLVLDSDTFYCSIYCIEGIDLDLIKQPLYETVDIDKEFGRCVIIEWKYDVSFFSVYGVMPERIKREDFPITYAINDESDLGTNKERLQFIESFNWFSEDKKLASNSITNLNKVEDWLFRASCFYSSMAESLLEEMIKQDTVKYFKECC